MISHLHNTTVSAINKELSHLAAANGSLSSGRVLTLVVLAEKGHSREAMRAAIRASHEHPSRIIVHISHDPLDPDQLDAEIHLGGDTGASEMIVLRGWGSASRPTEALISGLLLPDSPIVVWWPHSVPENPAQHSIGRIAQRRITDSARADDPKEALRKLTDVFRAGDTDLAWTALAPRSGASSGSSSTTGAGRTRPTVVGRGASRAAGPFAVVETKNPARHSPTDRYLWAAGHRPSRISKYATGMAVLHPELPANKWHRLLTRELGSTARAA